MKQKLPAKNALLMSLTSCFLLTACLDNDKNEVKKELVPADSTIYYNAAINTMDEQTPYATAMIVSGSSIVALGALDSFNERFSNIEQLSQVDLKKRYVLPGIVDAHTHPGLVAVLGGSSEDGEGFSPRTDSKENFFADLELLAQMTADIPFVFTGAWDVNMFLPAGPKKEDLDTIFGEKPVILSDNTGHSYWLNSAALAYLGINKDTPDLSKNISYFEKDNQGELTGWAKEFALIPYLVPIVLNQGIDIKGNLSAFLTLLSKHGVTALWDGGNFNAEDEIYSILKQLDDENKLPVRYYGSHHIFYPEQLETAVDDLKALRSKYQGNRLKFDTIKVHYDGVHELGTAYVKNEYQNINGANPNIGGVLFNAQQLSEFIQELNNESIDLHLHTVGDKATREALDAIKLAQESSTIDIEITLSHLEFTDPDDIQEFTTLNVHANFTPHWLSGAAQATYTTLGSDFVDSHFTPINSYFNHGANVTFSSDVIDAEGHTRSSPFLGMQLGITRTGLFSETGIVTQPAAEKASLEQMIAGYTINGAKQLDIDNIVGSLSVGKEADFIILETDLNTMDSDKLHQVKPSAVYLGGQLIAGQLPN